MIGVTCLGTSCGTPNPSGKIVLKLSTWGSSEEITVLRSILARFEREHPQIRVKLLHIPENYFQKLHILVAGGLTPDVMAVNSLSFPVYAKNGILKPLDEEFLASDSTIKRRDFFEPPLEALSWQGHLYAVPRDVSDLVIFYNQDLFRKAGLSFPSSDWTLAEFVAAGRRLSTGHGVERRFGFSFFAKPPLMWLPFVWSEAGDLFSSDLKTFELNRPQSLKGLRLYADLRNRWHIAPSRRETGDTTMSQLFIQEKLAMLLSGRWSVPVLRRQAHFHWDIVPFPKGPGGSVVGIDASGYAISGTSRHLKEAWMLVSFLSSRKSQEQFVQSGLIVPARKDIAGSPLFRASPPAHSQYFISAMTTGKPSHIPQAWNEVAEELGLALEPVWEGTKPADRAMAEVTPKIQRLLHE
jgi:multiple sugar transport system substrate-binding protein